MATEIRLPQWGMGMRTGTIVRWLKREGEPVQAGEPLVEVESAKVTSLVEASSSGVLLRILVPEGKEVPVRTVLGLIGAPGEQIADIAATGSPPATATTPASPAASTATRGPSSPVQVTPVARRLACDHGIDLSQVQGSGPGGRITEEDVQRAITAASRSAHVIPLTGKRGIIARRMHESLHTMAQVTLTTECDVTDMLQLRAELQQQFALTPTDLIIKAVAMVLKRHPRLNAWVEGAEIRLVPEIHLGIAVALEDSLIVPVVHDADRKSLREIAQETQRLTQHARAGTLTPEEVTGGTFTVTNLGMYGIDAFTPIINPPEVAILGIGRIVTRPAQGPQGLVWRQMLTFSLTFDHRAIDGAPAAAFLQALCEQLASPAALTR
jgi:pyruvate dehydrogenase E2 component (dihydrolipoamide acetyltransferase)